MKLNLKRFYERQLLISLCTLSYFVGSNVLPKITLFFLLLGGADDVGLFSVI